MGYSVVDEVVVEHHQKRNTHRLSKSAMADGRSSRGKMKIQKMIGFIAPVAKDKDDFSEEEIFAREIKSTSSLYGLLQTIFQISEKECDIQIRFISQKNQQDNEIRDYIQSFSKGLTIRKALPLIKRLSKLTDNKTKEGLVFIILGKEADRSKIMITRFPSETGIAVSQNEGKLDFKVIEDVFLKKSRKYKAVFYDSKEDYWIGHAIDKQINDNVGKIREISDYWIKDFLMSELKLNSKRGSSIIAKAIRRTISETDNDTIKSELVGITQTVKNINARSLTMNTFFDNLNLSEATKQEVLSKIENSNLFNITFQFDNAEFEKNCNYLLKIIDNGAIVMAPAADFDTIWQMETVKEKETSRFSTEGKTIKEKISNRV